MKHDFLETHLDNGDKYFSGFFERKYMSILPVLNNFLFLICSLFAPSVMIFGIIKKLFTIWNGIFACKHLISSNNFHQAKVVCSVII